MKDEDDRLEQLFQAAINKAPADRHAFLRRECGSDLSLLDEVLSLIAFDEAADQNPAWQSSALESESRNPLKRPDEHLGQSIGQYRLESLIGRGGMGSVYLAVRADSEYSQLAAIKLIRGGDDADEIVTRFRLERQILANLDHPNIARLLDGGTTPSGQPYLVMEYIAGEPLDAWCARHNPPLAQRLAIFRAICSAVHDAHLHMVIHRDLKPANILITADATPKLLDFGISKLMEPSMVQAATVTGFHLMTPRYASPEQVRGETVTAASDIFSLGVVLYELLTGHSPYAKPDGPLHEVTRSVCEEEPRKPGALAPCLRGDLESIVLMALRKDPKRRYSSASQFADDILKYEQGYPIAARPDTAAYRFRKFAARNKISVVAAALLFISLTAGIAATSWQAHIANRRFDEVRTLANSYLFEFHDSIRDLPGATPARQLVVKRALEFLGRLSAERGNDPQLARELAAAYAKVSAIQGGGQLNRSNLGDLPGAVASANLAVGILERLATSSPRDAGIAIELAAAYADLGELRRLLGDLALSVEFERKAITLLESFSRTAPGDQRISSALAIAYSALGDVMGNRNTPNLGDPKASLDLYRKALAIQERLAAEDAGNKDKQRNVGFCWARLAQIQDTLGDKPAGILAGRRFLEISEHLLGSEPLNTKYQWDAAIGSGNLSLSLLRFNQLQEARRHGDRALILYRRLAEADRNNAAARSALGDAYAIQGRIHEKANEPGPALDSYNKSKAAFEALASEHPGAQLPLGQRNVYSLLAGLFLKTRNIPGVIQYAEKQLAIDALYLQVNPKNANARLNQATANRQLGQAHELLAQSQSQLRAGELSEARHRYAISHRILLDLQKSGALAPAYIPDIATLAKLLAHLPEK